MLWFMVLFSVSTELKPTQCVVSEKQSHSPLMLTAFKLQSNVSILKTAFKALEHLKKHQKIGHKLKVPNAS